MAVAEVGTLRTTLNGICPYFTMFPLDFPLQILSKGSRKGDLVLDPFCGRGTTNLAARLLGLTSLGVDSSPVAVAITGAKLVTATPDEIVEEAKVILAQREPRDVPKGEFWQWAFETGVLNALCKFREAFMEECTSEVRIALRGVILGALHGPKQKTFQSYFSNQCPRTYAPKPRYATAFWKRQGMQPEAVNVMSIIERRSKRYYEHNSETKGEVRLADSRGSGAVDPGSLGGQFDWVITSPPYYGMRTYIPDQWLRYWFLGGPETVDYTNRDQIVHSSPDSFVSDLRLVWNNASNACRDGAKMVIRFGGITDRSASPLELITASLSGSNWNIASVQEAGTATEGKRQADAFLRTRTKPIIEYDICAEKH